MKKYLCLVLAILALGCGEDSEKTDIERPAFGKADGFGTPTILDDLAFGEVSEHAFDTDGQFFGYTFRAKPGTIISAEITRKGTASALDSTLFLLGRSDGEDWEEVAFDDDSGFGKQSRLRDVKLPENFAEFMAVLGTADGKGRGHYRFELQCESGECALPTFDLDAAVPRGWRTALKQARQADSYFELQKFLETEYAVETIYPPKEEVFNAFKFVSFNKVRVVLIGQDPYHGAGQAHGLAFSVQDGIKIPPSLRNVYKELESDIGISPPDHGNLSPWAEQGVLLLNTALTVREASPASHANRGWETFTDSVISELNDRDEPLVFILWGGHAKDKKAMIDATKHVIIEGAHPSPFSANNGFFGSQPFSKTNEALLSFGADPIDWSL